MPQARDWSHVVKQKAKQSRDPQVNELSRGLLGCCETIMDRINSRLTTPIIKGASLGDVPYSNHDADAIALADALDYDSVTTGNHSVPSGIMTAIKYTFYQAIQKHYGATLRLQSPELQNKLVSVTMGYNSEDVKQSLRAFIEDHPQLKTVPELATAECLYQSITTWTKQDAQDWLKAKPTRLNPEPPSGRIV